MKIQNLVAFVFCLVSGYAALPTLRVREVPQEHSHEAIVRACDQALKVDNPDRIVAAVFGLLDSDGASIGKGAITDNECLQAATADRAFTNAKNLNDVAAMTAALQYRTLERNTNQVGARSPNCTSFKPVNKEIAALSQHQDPAAVGARAGNRVVVLELARQIKAIGGDPQDALKTGTFRPGSVNDPTAKGNSCNDEKDVPGCIFSKSLLVQDVTPEEIIAAVGEAPNGGGSVPTPAVGDTDCIQVPVILTITDSPSSTPVALAAFVAPTLSSAPTATITSASL
ncbi:hypothetical protein FRC08_001457 [Ceratobasidium sp. 394]|nr:hypothetical protein FRC08_001457 [Ceratobasidium sp. 394]KAG9092235.1 hypothetical protein FS749_015903 [Ceratobasidium sp. UAMH 11750]